MEEIFLAPGFRFHPTDEELITYYLLRKVSDTAFTSKAVAVVDLNKSEPWDLPGGFYIYIVLIVCMLLFHIFTWFPFLFLQKKKKHFYVPAPILYFLI